MMSSIATQNKSSFEPDSSLLPLLRPQVSKEGLIRVSSRIPAVGGTSLLKSLFGSIKSVIFRSKISFLLIIVPAAIYADIKDLGEAWIFILSLIGLMPLAESLAFVTEEIANHTGATVGGLLNATCGNAPEMIIALFALHQNKVDLIKYSLLGSVLSNALLVLGMSLFCGGLMKKLQRFDKGPSRLNISMLMLATISISLPLAIKQTKGDLEVLQKTTLELSRGGSLMMLIAYGVYLFFQLKTHSQLLHEEEDERRWQQQEQTLEVFQEEEEESSLGLKTSLVSLCVITAFITHLSRSVVETIEDTAESWGMSLSFISIILLPLAGNAAEHAGAIMFATKDKLDLSLAVALGSSTQISMFVMPFITIVAWVMGKPVELDFNSLETVSMVGTVLITAYVLLDGTSNYLKGLILLLCYSLISFCFFLLKYPSANGNIFMNSPHVVGVDIL